MCSEINGWDNLTMARYLAVSLRGPAQQILTTLPESDRRSYRALVEALTRRFNPANQTELYRVQLRNRLRRNQESLPSLAQDIRRLAAQAYPTAHPSLMDFLCRDHFLDALVDPDTRMNVYRSRPRSLDEAVCIAVELEAFLMAERQRHPQRRPIRETKMDSEANYQRDFDNMRRAMHQDFQSMKAELVNGIRGGHNPVYPDINMQPSYWNNMGNHQTRWVNHGQNTGQNQAGLQQNPSAQGPRNGQNQGQGQGQGQGQSQGQRQGQSRRCYNCDQEGHFIRDCPYPRQDRNGRGGLGN